jgi:hypothetical protein
VLVKVAWSKPSVRGWHRQDTGDGSDNGSGVLKEDELVVVRSVSCTVPEAWRRSSSKLIS